MLTVTDLFCGAGGSSSGAEQVPGVRVRMAANHWKLAVETHNTNLPHADHDVADISQVDPRRYPSTDILWASPECTSHSQARGRRRDESTPDLFGEVLPDEAGQRSRATMWDVCRFIEAAALRGRPYRGFLVENVIEACQWMFYDSWRSALRAADYCVHVIDLNSMFAAQLGDGAPQSRDRKYWLGHLNSTRCPDLDRWTRPVARCAACDRDVRAVQAWKRPDSPGGRYRQQYVYRCPNSSCRHAEVYPWVLPAAAAIDWTLAGQRIGDRARPLAAKTLARIEAGLRRYARPVLAPAGGTWNDDATPVDQPMRTRTTRDTEGLAIPPFLALLRSDRARTIGVDQPLATVVANGSNHGLVVPVEGRENVYVRPAAEPLRTQIARLQDALVVPLRNNGVARPADQVPVPTVAAAGNHHALVMRNMTARGDQGQVSTPVTEPLRTVLASQVQSLVRWNHLLVPYYSTGVAYPVGEPVRTVTATDRAALVSTDVDVDDCLFRMLEPHEIQAAMAFTADYAVLGNKRERVRQLGNAVTPPAARDLIAALVEAITGDQIEAVS